MGCQGRTSSGFRWCVPQRRADRARDAPSAAHAPCCVFCEPSQTLGNEGLYSLLAGHTDHSAYCQCILGFSAGPGAEPVLFVGRTPGSIVPPASTGGFAWDAIFVPEGHTAPFSSMTLSEKNRISHRARALRRFVDYLLQHQDAVIKAIVNKGEGADLPSCRRSLHEYGGATRDAAPPPGV